MRALPTLLLTFSLLAGTARASDDLPGRLDAYMKARTSLGAFSGTVVVAREGTVLLNGGYGYANLEHRVVNGARTKFEIASLTKAFTAAAILRLQDQGKLRLTDPVCRFLPDCPAAWSDVTIDEVIHHTSGIPDYEAALELGSDAYTARMVQPGTGRTLVEEAKKKPLDFAAGSKYRYSNTGYLLLGQIIERASGKPYEQFLREQFFAPLGMRETQHADASHVVSGAAYGYTHEAPLFASVKGFPLTERWLRPVIPARLDAPHADGGLLSTADDLYRWAEALDGRGPALDEATRKELLRTVPAAPTYAFGWIIGTRFDHVWIHHLGVLPGFVSTIERYPDEGVVIVVLSNLERSRLSNITRDLAAIVFGAPYDTARSHEVHKLESVPATLHTGDYVFDDGTRWKVGFDAAGGMLELSQKDAFVAGALAEAGGSYYVPMWEGVISFDPATGDLISHRNGVDKRAHRAMQ
jgi:CubicO group peptidase (beta-lactamase class C family)